MENLSVWDGGYGYDHRRSAVLSIERRWKKTLRQPGLESFVTIIPQLFLFGLVFGTLVRFADPRPRAEVPSLVLQDREFGRSIELGESTKFNGP